LCASPRSKPAGQTDVLDEQHGARLERQAADRVTDHVRIKVTTLAGIDLNSAHAGCAYPLGVIRGLLVAFHDGQGAVSAQPLERLREQRRLPRPGTRNQIQRQHAAFLEQAAVLPRIDVVLGEDVLLDLHHPRLAHPRRMRPRGSAAVVMMFATVPVAVVPMVVVVVVVVVPVPMRVHVIVFVPMAVERAGLAASANRTHLSPPPVP